MLGIFFGGGFFSFFGVFKREREEGFEEGVEFFFCRSGFRNFLISGGIRVGDFIWRMSFVVLLDDFFFYLKGHY